MKEYNNYDFIDKNLKDYNIDDYINVLSHINEVQSKYMFYYRTMLDNTDDPKYALLLEKSMYYNSNFLSKNDIEMYHYLNFMLSKYSKDKKMYLIGEDILSNMIWAFYQKNEGLNIETIYDNFCEEKYINDYDKKKLLIKPLSDIYSDNFGNKDSIFIIVNREYSFIRDYLVSDKSIKEDNIFTFTENPTFYNRVGQYFFETFYKLSSDEVFADVGADKLSSTLQFIDFVHNNYQKIYAFEPLLRDYNDGIKQIKDYDIKNIEYQNIGIWSSSTTLNFSDNEMTFGSGNNMIDVKKLDDCIKKSDNVSVIKMDIEGAEYDALLGAKNIIKNNNPLLMICIYHNKNDAIKLAKLILSFNDKYEIFIRHYTFSIFETVMYFVPKNKLNKIFSE